MDHACFGILTAGGTLVTIQTNRGLPERLHVLAFDRAVFVEDAEQLEDPQGSRELPDLRHIVVMEPGADYTDDALTTRGYARAGRSTSH